MSAPRHRRLAAGAALGALLLAGCGGSDDKASDTQRPADRTQRTDAGARAALREYVVAFTTADGKKICDLLDPTSPAMRSISKQRCRRETSRLKNVLTPAAAARYRQQFAALKPVVKGDVATLPGSNELSLRYIDGRWYVSLVPTTRSSPAS